MSRPHPPRRERAHWPVRLAMHTEPECRRRRRLANPDRITSWRGPVVPRETWPARPANAPLLANRWPPTTRESRPAVGPRNPATRASRGAPAASTVAPQTAGPSLEMRTPHTAHQDTRLPATRGAQPHPKPPPPPPKATARTRMWSMFHVKRRVSHALQAQTHRALTSASLPADSGGRQRAISRHVATAGPRDTRPGPPSPSQGPIVARSEPTATLRLTRKHTALHTRPRPTTADRLTRQESRHDHSPSARRPSGTRMRHARLLPCRSGIRDYTPRSPTTREPGAQRRTRRQPPPHRGLSDVTTCVAAPTDPVW